MFTIPYYKYEEVITDIYAKLNGKVNKNILSQKLEFSNNEYSNSLASTTFSTIIINILKISEVYGSMRFFTLCGQLVFIIIHELSHIEQDVNLHRYSSDSDYRSNIELYNNANSYSFFNDNYEYIESLFPDYNFEYLNIKNNYLETKDLVSKYKKASYHKYLENIFDGYIFSFSPITENKSYNQYDNISINAGKELIIIKEDGKTINNDINKLNKTFDDICNSGFTITSYNDKSIMISIHQTFRQVAYRMP